MTVQSRYAAERNLHQTAVERLHSSLATLINTAGQLECASEGHTGLSALRERLHTSARRAETAMHDLRGTDSASTPAAMELSQSLTVLVLIADMVVSGHLSPPEALGSETLFFRNARRASVCLEKLRGLSL